MAVTPERVVADGLVLRAYRPADEPALLAAFADESTAQWNPGPADGDISAWWQRRNDWSDGEHASWGVADSDDILLGSVSIFKIDPAQSTAMIGYFVLPGARNRGIARRAVVAAARYAFGQCALHRIELYHAVENIASCRVAAAAGFRPEGELRESYRYADGRFHDEHLHARLVTD